MVGVSFASKSIQQAPRSTLDSPSYVLPRRAVYLWMRLVRGNAWTEIRDAPTWFVDALAVHLSVPCELQSFKLGVRFGGGFQYGSSYHGSLVHKGRVVAAGLTPHVQMLAQHYGIPYSLHDLRERPSGGYPWHTMPAFPWRPYQDRVHESLIEHGVGVVDALPRSGKTAMAARVLDVLAMPTVYTAPSLPIVRQTYERFCTWFGDGMVARLDGEASSRESDISKPIVIATAASAVRQSREWWRTRKVLVIDEFHHAAAETYHAINDLADHIFHRYAFTGTHFRTGEDSLAMEAVCSQVLARVGLAELVGEGFLARPRVFFVRTGGTGMAAENLSYDLLYKQGIAENAARNAQVCDVVNALRDRGVPTIVLTRRRKHADDLGNAIADSVVVKGGEQALTSKAVKDFAKGRFDVLIGTTVIGEGVDLPRAAALVYASGGNGGVGMMQSYFRPLTAIEEKPIGRIYDFWDDSCRVLAEQSKDRLEYARTYLGAENVVLSA